MKTLAVLSLLLASLPALAATPLDLDGSDTAAAVSTVESVKIFSDKQIGAVKVVSFANGSAANPVNVSLMLESADQRGDNANFDVFPLAIGFVDSVKATLSGEFVIIAGKNWDSATGKSKAVTLKIQVKNSGKRLAVPEVL